MMILFAIVNQIEENRNGNYGSCSALLILFLGIPLL